MRRVLFLLLAISVLPLSAQEKDVTEKSVPSDVVNELYELLSTQKGETRDWEKVASLFHPDAIIVLRTGRETTTKFGLEGFLNDFKKFVKDYKVVETGFVEKILKTELFEFGDIAHVLVLYEAFFPVEGFKPQKGVDSIQLIKVDGKWLIFSIINEVPMPGRPLPESLEIKN